MTRLAALLSDRSAAAAAEFVLILPMMLILMWGTAEVGNYFMNQHMLVKAVRDGARFAARQNFNNYTGCSGAAPASVTTPTANLVMNGYLSGGTLLVPNITSSNVAVTSSCTGFSGGQQMLGLYRNRANGAQTVTVSARVTYRPLVSQFGFTGANLTLNAKSQAAVMGS